MLNATVTPTTTAALPITLTATANDTRFNNSNGVEPTQIIAAARYSIDTPSWITGTVTQPMTATDGLFNTSVEGVTAVVNTSGLTVGRHTLFIEAQDASGNWGVPSAVFIEVAPKAVQGGLPQLTPDQQTGGGLSGNARFLSNRGEEYRLVHRYIHLDSHG